MKYQGVCIAVKDINLSKKFYQDLFELEVYQDYGINISFGGLSLQQDFDWLIGKPKESIVNKSHNMELYFEQDDFDAFVIKLKKRSDIDYLDEEIKEASWGQRSIKFYDLDGHIIEVGEDMRAVINRFLDAGMSMEETSKRMDVSIADLEKLLGGYVCVEGTMNDLISNIDKLHTTQLGIARIKKNLCLNETMDVVYWCKTKILSNDCVIKRKGKNWYAFIDNCVITVNANSYTIITAHKE